MSNKKKWGDECYKKVSGAGPVAGVIVLLGTLVMVVEEIWEKFGWKGIGVAIIVLLTFFGLVALLAGLSFEKDVHHITLGIGLVLIAIAGAILVAMSQAGRNYKQGDKESKSEKSERQTTWVLMVIWGCVMTLVILWFLSLFIPLIIVTLSFLPF
jgi:hypothetical protein